ncbi:hypothetical protein ES332_A05G308500v1 [Gossypium tomentosum]|nr:hypothetical protein ES332_A05G308500v1 [Gossypium tomentosum]
MFLSHSISRFSSPSLQFLSSFFIFFVLPFSILFLFPFFLVHILTRKYLLPFTSASSICAGPLLLQVQSVLGRDHSLLV